MGAFTSPVDGAWVAHLRAAAGGAHPMKWQHVHRFVNGESSDAAIVRAGLAQAVIVIVDPMTFLRQVDFTWAGVGGVPPFAMWYDVPQLRALRRRLERLAADGVLALSGVQRIVGLLTDSLGIVDLGDRDANLSRFTPTALLDRLGGGLGKATRLAASATTALVYEDDPDVAASPYERYAALAAGLRFADDSFLARARLEAFVDRRVVFDGGHDDVVRTLADLQNAAAERRALYAPYLDLGIGGGYIRSGDDKQQLQLQLADIAAGYARDVLETFGVLEVWRRFRVVLHNGFRLDGDEARRYDEERTRHRRLVAKCLGETFDITHIR